MGLFKREIERALLSPNVYFATRDDCSLHSSSDHLFASLTFICFLKRVFTLKMNMTIVTKNLVSKKFLQNCLSSKT